MRRLRVADRATCPRTSVTITCQRCRPSTTGRRRRQAGGLRRAEPAGRRAAPGRSCCPRGPAPSAQASAGQARAPPVRRRRSDRGARPAVVDGDRELPARLLGPLHVGDRRVAGRGRWRRRSPRCGSTGPAAGSDSVTVARERRRDRQRRVVLEQSRVDLGRRSGRRSGEPGGDAVGVLAERRVGLRRARRRTAPSTDRRRDRVVADHGGERRAAGRLDDGDAGAVARSRRRAARRRCRSRARRRSPPDRRRRSRAGAGRPRGRSCRRRRRRSAWRKTTQA